MATEPLSAATMANIVSKLTEKNSTISAVEVGELSSQGTPQNEQNVGSASKTSSPVDIDYLLSQLTLEEKVSLAAGQDWWTTSPVPRLGIPSLKFSDGPNGARGTNFVNGVTSACFPAAVSLAATFDRDAAHEVGRALADETRTKGASVLLGPTVCMQRDPRGGRNFEAFSEDPLVSGEMAAAYINGLQGGGIGASLKHFCVNEEETFRFTMDIIVDDRTLREIYLRPFEIAVKKSQPWTVMTSFSHIDGIHASAHKELLGNVLRKQWGFDGLVLSDWSGTYSVGPALEAGLNLEMPGPPIQRTLENITKAFEKGELSQQALDKSVWEFLRLLQRTGKFESPEIPAEIAIDLPYNRELIRRTGADGMVLLKNERSILPIKTEDRNLKSIALIGLAKSYLGYGGGSAAVNSHHKITPYDAFVEAVAGKGIELKYAEGARPVRTLPQMTHEVYGEDGNPGFTCRVTTPATGPDTPVVSNVATANFVSVLQREVESVSLNGIYKPSVSGNHYISFKTVGNSTVYINDEPVFHQDGATDVLAYVLNVAREEKKQYNFIKGQEYRIRIEAHKSEDLTSGLAVFASGLVGVTVGFMAEQDHDAPLLEPAVETAKESDIAIVFVGHDSDWESEGADRDSMDLPRDGSLDRLISAVAKANPNTIVVNSTGSPVTMPWIDDIAALLQAWLPGQEAGHAITDVLLGIVSPGGKLPCTFPKSLEVSPTYGNFPGDLERRRVEYKEGIFVGYRYYDEHPEAVLFPFGHGLSYSSFELANARLSNDVLVSDGDLTVTVNVTNTGSVTASEVVQVYVGAFNPSISRPKKELGGFSKVRLSPGGSQAVQVTLSVDAVSYWDTEKGLWSVDAGEYQVFIGESSVSFASTLAFKVEAPFEIFV